LRDYSKSEEAGIVKNPTVIYPEGFDKNQHKENQTCQILVKGKF
jgi:hypothetical protein